MKHGLAQTKEALENIELLIKEVSAGHFIPKKFRKKPFTIELRDTYVAYLEDEADRVYDLIQSQQPRSSSTTPSIKVIAPRVLAPVFTPVQSDETK